MMGFNEQEDPAFRGRTLQRSEDGVNQRNSVMVGQQFFSLINTSVIIF